MGRAWQLALTLPHNLKNLRQDEEWCILDYNSDDQLWYILRERAPAWIERGQLRYYRTLVPQWFDTNRAKNAAHRLARGSVVFNLDADNFIDPSVRRQLARCEELYGDRFVLQNRSDQVNSPYLPAGDGTYGRIAMPRTLFNEIGGYDEQMLGMGNGDADILHRASRQDIRVVRSTKPPEHMPIPNALRDKSCNMRPDLQARGFNNLNAYHARFTRYREDLDAVSLREKLPGVFNFSSYAEDPGEVPHSVAIAPPSDVPSVGKHVMIFAAGNSPSAAASLIAGVEAGGTIQFVGMVTNEERAGLSKLQSLYPDCLIQVYSGQPGYVLSRLHQTQGDIFSTAVYTPADPMHDIAYIVQIHHLLAVGGTLHLQRVSSMSQAIRDVCMALFPGTRPPTGEVWPLVKSHKIDGDMMFHPYELPGVDN